MKPFFVLMQYCLPHHLCSRIVGKFIQVRYTPVKNALLRWFIKRYHVDLAEAEIERYQDYPCFNAFFTRALKKSARPMSKAALISPADGLVSAIGKINDTRLFQAKGRDYTLNDLLANDPAQIKALTNGQFATIYLSPKDYHCVHMPKTGKLVKTTYVPGRLFSVNAITAKYVPHLFARNERLICEFETDDGMLVVIFVGAMIVAGIETVFGGIVAPSNLNGIQTQTYDKLAFEQGDKLGHFFLGSTVIVLVEGDKPLLASRNSLPIQFGETLT
jgi:phosphatidylserine decarboxylase